MSVEDETNNDPDQAQPPDSAPQDSQPTPTPGPEGVPPVSDAAPIFPPVPQIPVFDGPVTEPLTHAPVSARVPEAVTRGVFATGVIVQEGQGEFVLDFVQSLTRPPQIAARVVMTPTVLRALVSSLADNIAKYTSSFGPPPRMPRPPQPPRRQSTQELYEHFKLPESLWSGAYANSVLIGHNPGEFFLDFITRFYPQAAVSCRVYLSAAQAPRVQETLATSLQQHLAKRTPPEQ